MLFNVICAWWFKQLIYYWNCWWLIVFSQSANWLINLSFQQKFVTVNALLWYFPLKLYNACVRVYVLVCQVVCVGSMAELEELTGVKVTDLHRERWVTDQTSRLTIWMFTQWCVSAVIVCDTFRFTGCVCVYVCVSPCCPCWICRCHFNVTCLPEPDHYRETQITLLFRSSSANYL